MPCVGDAPVTADGELSGFDIDLVRAVAKDILGDPGKVTYLAIPTSRRISALQTGKVDIVARTMTITCERIGQVAFSTAYFESGQQVMVPKGSPVTPWGPSPAARTRSRRWRTPLVRSVRT